MEVAPSRDKSMTKVMEKYEEIIFLSGCGFPPNRI
jgi:hypothetical protein